MENKREYLERVKLALEPLHDCRAEWIATFPVQEMFQGQPVWDGEVEMFKLTGHPKTEWAYGWSHREGKNDEGERFVAVLELPPVISAKTAVQAHRASQRITGVPS